MSRKTKITDPFYKSQATTQRCQLHSPNRLYGSGANAVVSPPKMSEKLMHQNICHSPRMGNKYQRAIDALTTTTNYKNPSTQIQQLYARKKYSQDVRWQSPLKIPQKRQAFRSIIEEIHEHNDKALQQLDDDIRRIKNNLAKVQQEKNIEKKNHENQLLSEQIQLLQDQNERLRTKNFEMIEQKKKLTQTIQRYETFIHQEKTKLATVSSIKHSTQQKSIEEFMSQKLIIQERLRQKQMQNEKLKFQVQKLQKTLQTYNQSKKQVIQVQQISRLNRKIIELQKELADTTLNYQQNLKIQLEKKDKYYLNWIEITKSKNQEALKKLQSNHREQKNNNNEELLKTKQRDLANLRKEANLLAKRQEELVSKIEKNETQINQLKAKIENVNNENQFLSFTHKQTAQRLKEKEEQKKQLQKKLHILQTQLQKTTTQETSIGLMWQQQKKRNSLLQQLYNRLQKQYQSYESESQNHLLNYKKAICDYQHELSQAKYQFDKLKEKNYHLQRKLQDCLKDNQKLCIQNLSRNEQICCLKKEKIMLLNSQNQQTKLQSNPITRTQKYQSPIKYETRQRFLSGEPRINTNLVRQRQKQKLVQFKKLEKELQTMIQDLRLQKQKQRNIFKQKEKTYKSAIQNHRKQTEEYQNKIQIQKSDIQKIKLQKLTKQEEAYDLIRKKDGIIMNKQLKLNELQLKLTQLESQAKMLKDLQETHKSENFFNQSKIKKQIQDSSKQIKTKFHDFLEKIIKELNKIEDNLQTYTVKTFIFHSHEMNQFSSLVDFRKLSELNYLVQSLKQKFRTLTIKNKELQKKYQERVSTQKARTDIQNQQSIKIKVSSNEEMINRRQQRKIIQSQEQEIKSLKHKMTELEIEYEKQSVNYKSLIKEKDQKDRLIKDKILQIGSLIQKAQSLEKEVSKLKQKQQSYIIQAQKLKNKLQIQKEMAEYKTPRKQLPNTRHNVEIVTQNQIPLNSRLDYFKREFLSQKKPSYKNIVDKSNQKQMQKKLIDMQLIKMNYENQISKRKQEYEEMKGQKEQLQRKLKRLNERYEEKMNKIQYLQEQIQSLRNKLNKSLQSTGNHEKDMKVLVSELEVLNEKYDNQRKKFSYQTEQKQQKLKDLAYQCQILQRKLKKEVIQKDSQRISETQKHELHIVELQSELNKMKQKIGHYQSQIQTLKLKNDKILHRLQTNNLKLQQKQKEIKYLSQRLQEQRTEKQKLFTIFNTNTTKLSKLLQEKQIEIEQLKFIQQSTIINYHSERTSKAIKKQTQSAYSFQQQQ